MSRKLKSWPPNFGKKFKVPLGCMYLWCCCQLSILCTSFDLGVYIKFSGITDHLVDSKNFVCCKCSGEIYLLLLHDFREVNIRNDRFHVESTFKYLVDTFGQCGCCSDAVSMYMVSWWRAFQELLPILTSLAIRTKLRGNVINMCVRKVLLCGSETWSVVTETVQQLFTAGSGMIRWIFGMFLKDCIHLPCTCNLMCNLM